MSRAECLYWIETSIGVFLSSKLLLVDSILAILCILATQIIPV